MVQPEEVASKLAREVARLHEWPDKVWSRRYQAIVVSEEEAAQAGRLKYLLSHGVKEGLVAGIGRHLRGTSGGWRRR